MTTMAMTEEEKQTIVRAVLDIIRAESSDIAGLETADSLDNLTSLPAQQGEKLVQAPLHLLAKPATDAAAVANSAAQKAETAARQAETSAGSADTAGGAAADAAEAANAAAEAASGAAAEVSAYTGRLRKAEDGVAVRIHGFSDLMEVEDGSMEITTAGLPVWYDTARKVFYVVEGITGFRNFPEAGLYSDGDFHPLKDKVYLYGTDMYVWDDAADNLVKAGDRMRHVALTEAEYEALESYDSNTIYLIYEEDDE